jgi:4-hydroxy-2-oxoglutarate aldolase
VPNSPISVAGVFPPIPTPFTAEGTIDYEHLKSNLGRWNREPLAGYVVGGSNGEYVSLTPDERVEMVRQVKALLPEGKLLIAGSGMESTAGTIELTKRMAEAGGQVALIVNPNYYKRKLMGAALEKFYKDVADASPIPTMIYNVPANTGVDIPAGTVVALARHPNIIGMKDSGGDVAKIGYIVQETPPEFQVLAGSAGFFLGALAMGAVGGVMALANLAGGRLAQILESFKKGDLAGARAIQLPLITANSAVTSRFGVAGLKAALDLMSYYGGPVRAPLLPLSDDDKAVLRGVLSKASLL